MTIPAAPPAPLRVAVIGGGVLGLTVALRLSQRGHAVRVLEQSAIPGGLASSFEVAPDTWLERFYHHIFGSDRSIIALIDELGFGDRLRWYEPTSTLLVDGTPWRLDSVGALLRFSPLPAVDRLRLGAVLAALKLLPSPSILEAATADAWMRRAAGARAHETVWEPLLDAKFGASRDAVSMAWLWARIHDRTSRIGYLDGGFHQLYTALAGAATAAGATIDYGTRARAVRRSDATIELEWDAAGETRREAFDRVVSTLPPVLTGRLAPELEPWAAATASPHAPRSAHCLILELDRPLSGVYWVGIPEDPSGFVAVVEHTAMVPAAQYGGRTLVYAGAYRDASDTRPREPLEAQIAMATPVLQRLNPAFSADWVRHAWSFDAPFAQPIVDPGFRARIPDLETPIPGLWCASMFHVYPHDRGQNYSVALAERLAARIAEPA